MSAVYDDTHTHIYTTHRTIEKKRFTRFAVELREHFECAVIPLLRCSFLAIYRRRICCSMSVFSLFLSINIWFFVSLTKWHECALYFILERKKEQKQDANKRMTKRANGQKAGGQRLAIFDISH